MRRKALKASRRLIPSAVRPPSSNALLCQEFRSTVPVVTNHLVGLTEIATMLGVSRQRVGQLVRDYDDFPSPVAELASGRIWETAAVEAWAIAHPVRPPGRPVGESDRGERL